MIRVLSCLQGGGLLIEIQGVIVHRFKNFICNYCKTKEHTTMSKVK